MTKRKTKTDNTDKSSFGSYIKLLWLGVVALLFIVCLLFIFISKTQLPDTQELEQPDYEIATTILADDGRELGKAFRLNREWLQFEEINPYIVDALISTEDERYYSHSGIDVRGTMRAVIFMGKRGGASTITQQLAKLFFTNRSSSFFKRVWQKLKEWVIAIEFEKRYTKGEIIAMYLNKYDFLYGANGVAAAAKTYFGKDQSQLTVDEAAVLVGLLKNPWIYNPKPNPENAHNRRNVVMKQMVKNEKLDEATYKELVGKQIDLSNFNREDNYQGIASYFRAELAKSVKELLKDDKYKKPDGTKYDLYTDGLTINTTIDLDMQKHAEAAMIAHMSQLQDRYFRVWKNKDPWTYNADDQQKKIRQSNLQRQIRESERFKNMRLKYLSDISSKISSSINDARLWDSDIFRLFNEEKKNGYLADLVKRKQISKDQAKTYKEILNSKYWPELKKAWLSLQGAKDKVFRKKVKMKVFDYSKDGHKYVEMSPLDSIKYHNMHLQIGSISVDPKSGYIKTWIGGVGHEYFKFDHINSRRQVGSTFKPFVYLPAIKQLGISPCQKFVDQQYTILANDQNFNLSENWSPANASNTFTNEEMTLKDGLKQSKNSISVALMKELGNVETVRDFAAARGITKEHIPPYPSICLGTPELSVMEMAGAYSTFANDGMYIKPAFIKSIQDANGRVIYQSIQERKRVENSSYNYVMVNMLQYAASFISGWYQSEVGGKTGTTNDYRDGWFMGITPDLVVATWVGGESEWIRFNTLANGQGGVMARPFFTEFLTRLEKDPSTSYDKTAKFVIPENQIVELDCSIYEEMEAQDVKAQEILEKEKEEYDSEFDEEF